MQDREFIVAVLRNIAENIEQGLYDPINLEVQKEYRPYKKSDNFSNMDMAYIGEEMTLFFIDKETFELVNGVKSGD